MPEPVVRISQGFFRAEQHEAIAGRLQEGRTLLDPALRALPGLIHYYVSIDPVSHSMVNVSVWESLEAASRMSTLPEMLAQRDVFTALGVAFQPIRNYAGLWSIQP
jgi:quinol monooxygenase YgiN